MHKIQFTDAYEIHKENPTTFEIPTEEEINSIKIGSFIKVCAGRERFWVKVSKIEDNVYQGNINNHLMLTNEHGYKDNDLVSIKKNIFIKYILNYGKTIINCF
jgi:hypothetical protein